MNQTPHGADDPMAEATPDFLSFTLAGRQMTSVEFVCDYVQLHFGGRAEATINAITPIEAILSGRVLSWDDPGYRDALCSEIGGVVSAVRVEPNEAFEIDWRDGVRFRISLRDEDRLDVEAVQAYVDRRWWIY